MKWTPLTNEAQLQGLITASQTKPQVVFKHSTRCSISAVAYQRLQKADAPDGLDFYFLDILEYRPLSNKIVELFQVPHESPQVLIIRNGECVFDDSHLAISMNLITEHAKTA